MWITLIAFLFSFKLIFWPPAISSFTLFVSAALMTASGTVVLMISILMNILIMSSLERIEQKLIPDLVQMVRLDPLLKIERFVFFVFLLFSYLFAFSLTVELLPLQGWIIGGWIAAFGLTLDLILDYWKRLTCYLSPADLVNNLVQAAKKEIFKQKNNNLSNSLDKLAEIGLHAVEQSKIALGNQTVQAFSSLIYSFFTSLKDISYKKQESKTTKEEISFTIFYLIERLELINDKALQKRLETICRQIIMTMGKIIDYSAKYDLSMVSFPVHFLTKFGLKAQQHHFDEVGVLTTSTLLEISKTIINAVKNASGDLQDPFRAIINGLKALAKGTFQKDKQTSISVLMQPFEELKILFQEEKMVEHQDRPTILLEINQVLEEFVALQEVMRTLPPIAL